MNRTLVLSSAVSAIAHAEEPAAGWLGAMGFVRGARNGAFKVANITEEMRLNAPASLDWSVTGATTPVKDQGGCGSCWAYSATEGIESAVFMATGEVRNLSAQQIISCDKVDLGCRGGDLQSALRYAVDAGGLDSAAHYPDVSHTTEKTEECEWSGQKVVTVTDWYMAVPPCEATGPGEPCNNQDEAGLKAALHNFGPLSVCINAAWYDYRSGVLNATCPGGYDDLNHCVQLVGYDTTVPSPYWKVRNSWNTFWGEDGFIRLPMGINSCGIANEAAFAMATVIDDTISV